MSAVGGRLRSSLWIAVAGAAPLCAGVAIHRQGFRLLEDGLWLLGATTLRQGGRLYADLFVSDGPARYALLLPFLSATSGSALALALLKACCDGVAGALGFVAARRCGARGWAWLVPAGVIALGPIPPWLLGLETALWVGATLLLPRARTRHALLAGSCLGAMACFGLGALLASGALLALLLALPLALPPALPPHAEQGQDRTRRAVWGPAVIAWACAVALAVLVAVSRAPLSTVAWDVVTHPVQRWMQQLRADGLISWVALLRAGGLPQLAFSEVASGEQLSAAWPAQVLVRNWALRLLLVGIWVLPLCALWSCWRERSAARWRAPSLLALLGWCVLVPAGDLPHLRVAALAQLPLLALVLANLATARRPGRGATTARAAAIAMALLALAPLLAERLWLLAHARRATLQTWARPTAQIALAPQRWQTLEAVFAEAVRRAGSPTAVRDSARSDPVATESEPRPSATSILIWPQQPGLYALLDTPLPCAQATLLPGEVRDPATVLAQLRVSRPRVAMLSPQLSDSRDVVRRDAPALWDWLRDNFSVIGDVPGRPDAFRLLEWVPGGPAAVQALPLPQRLPDLEQAVGNDASPALRHDFTVGQTFPVGESDLIGVAVRWRTKGEAVQARVRVAVWLKRSDRFDTLVAFYDVDVAIARDLERSYLRFGPVPDTAHQTVALTFELLEPAPAAELRLVWHRHDAGSSSVDFLGEGSALVNMAAVPADLYLLAY